MHNYFLPILLLIMAGVFQGTFGLGMRRFAPLAWEAYWALFAVTGMVIVPYLWTSLTVPDAWAAIASVRLSQLSIPFLCGVCWGFGAIMFGRAVNYIGISITYGIDLGLSAAAGSLIPLFGFGGASSGEIAMVLLAVGMTLLGVGIITVAAVIRDRTQLLSDKETVRIQTGKLFYLGLFFAAFDGTASALLNIGHIVAEPVAIAAATQGASVRNASLVSWQVILCGGLLTNLSYAIFQMVRNKSYRTYWTQGSISGYLSAVITALLWFAALGLYGQGAAIAGKLGHVFGWSMFLSLSLAVGNGWAIYMGEWKGVPGPLKILILGDLVLVLASVVNSWSLVKA